MCEIARNSILQSGFEHSIKKQWIGENLVFKTSVNNNISKTNVPDIRLRYRHECLNHELNLLKENFSNKKIETILSEIVELHSN